MEVFLRASTQMLILAAIVLIGFYCRKKDLMNAQFDSRLSKIVMTFTMPALIIDSVLSNSNPPSTDVVISMLGYSLIIYTFCSIFAFVLGRFLFWGKKFNTRGAYAFLIAYGNTGFMGFPVIASLFGYDFVLLAAVYNIGFNLFLFSVGYLFISRTGKTGSSATIKEEVFGVLKTFISPAMISSYIAVLLAFLGINDADGAFGTATNLIGGVTVPAAMMLIGSSLATMKAKEMFGDVWVYVVTAIRLILMPLLTFFLMGFIVTDPTILAIITIICGMPAATVGTMMCVSYGGDIETMTRGTFMTTVFSVISIPILAMLVI